MIQLKRYFRSLGGPATCRPHFHGPPLRRLSTTAAPFRDADRQPDPAAENDIRVDRVRRRPPVPPW